MCFLCLWDSRAKEEHCVRRQWLGRHERIAGRQSIEHAPLVEPQDILLPSLHIKLGLFKNFVKSASEAMEILRKEGVFVGQDVRKIINTNIFRESLNETARHAFDAMVLTVHNFLSANRSTNYAEIVNDVLEKFRIQKVYMSLKIHFLHSHPSFFEPTSGKSVTTNTASGSTK